MKKIRVYHFNNGTGGGVLSVIKNLLEFSKNPAIENHIIYTINTKLIKHYTVNNLKGASSEQVFYFSPASNFYHTCKGLAKLLPDDNAIIISHDLLELAMVSHLGLKNKVIAFLHGDYDYYYGLAKLHEKGIDKFIAVAKNIAVNVKKKLPDRKEDVFYQRFPVAGSVPGHVEKNLNKIVFTGRLNAKKGYNLLPEVEKLLKNNGINLHWHIIGDCSESKACKTNWDKNSSVKLYGHLSNEEVCALLPAMDFFILPSLAEGMPVSLIEAMKAGVIPLANDISGGIQELIENDVTGFKITGNSPVLYAEILTQLVVKKEFSATISAACKASANSLFDPWENTASIEDTIYQCFLSPSKHKKAERIYGSRLDQKWIPDVVTKTIRHFTKK